MVTNACRLMRPVGRTFYEVEDDFAGDFVTNACRLMRPVGLRSCK